MSQHPQPGNGSGLTLDIFILVAISVVLGVAVNAFRPEGSIAWVQDWDHFVETRALREGISLVGLEQARQLAEEGRYLVFDARSRQEYDEGHVPGAMSVPFREIDEIFVEVQFFLTPEQPVLTYCSSLACDDALMLSLFLRDQGFTNVVMFAGGMQVWRGARYPVEGGP